GKCADSRIARVTLINARFILFEVHDQLRASAGENSLQLVRSRLALTKPDRLDEAVERRGWCAVKKKHRAIKSLPPREYATIAASTTRRIATSRHTPEPLSEWLPHRGTATIAWRTDRKSVG